MPSFVLTCRDKPGALDLRVATRETHLAYLKDAGVRIELAGPLLDDAGQMAGSLLVIEAPDRAAAEAFSAGDPYAKAGLFESVAIQAIKVTIRG